MKVYFSLNSRRKKEMKKWLIGLALSVAVLAGCGDGDKETEKAETLVRDCEKSS